MKNKLALLTTALIILPTIAFADDSNIKFTLECTVNKTTAGGLFTNGKKAVPLDLVGNKSITNINLELKQFCDEICDFDYDIFSINGDEVVLELNEFYNEDPDDIYDRSFTLNTKTLTTHVWGSNYDKAGTKKVGTYDFTETCVKVPYQGLSDGA